MSREQLLNLVKQLTDLGHYQGGIDSALSPQGHISPEEGRKRLASLFDELRTITSDLVAAIKEN